MASGRRGVWAVIKPTWTSDCGTVRLYHGDCLEILPHLSGVDAVVTDPPYGVEFRGKTTKHTRRTNDGYIGGDSEIGPEVVRKCLPIAQRCVVFPGIRLMWKYPEPYEVGAVSCPSGAGHGRWGWICSHPILYYGKPPSKYATPNGFTSYDTQIPNGHPCPKPEPWMEWAVKKATRDAETVLDPFMGSGTTGVACVRLGRSFIGIELERKYFDIAKQRIQDELRRVAFLEPKKSKEVQRSLLEPVQ
jgi:site-specific DNA-methyltransferase (adenine-specific)